MKNSKPKTSSKTVKGGLDAGALKLRVVETPLAGGEVFSVKPLKLKKKRVWELDFLRGLAILLVAMDHTFYDCFAIFGDAWSSNAALANLAAFARNYHSGALREFWKPIFLFVFFFVSGISSRFSKSNLFRSFKLVAAALFINFATYILETFLGMSGSFVKFGVIQCFAVIVMIYAAIELLVHVLTLHAKHLKKWVLSFACLGVAIVVFIVNAKYNVSVMDFELHGKYSSVVWDSPLAPMFFYIKGGWTLPSADYFPLFPFLGYFMLGAGLTSFLYPNKKSLLPFLDGWQRLPMTREHVYIGWWHKIFTVPGRYSLVIFIAWQVAAVAILGAVTLIVFGELPFF